MCRAFSFSSMSLENSSRMIQQAMFRVTRNLLGTPKRTCLSVICSSVVGQLRWKEHIKKHKKVSDFSHKQIRFHIFAQN